MSGEHLAGRYVHLALPYFVLQIGAFAHVFQRGGLIGFGKGDPGHDLAALDPPASCYQVGALTVLTCSMRDS